MADLTVIIPTHRRPAFLRSTLASVADQSAVDQIAKVLVRENSDDPRSQAVCTEFGGLPIHHVFRSPPLEPGAHFSQLLSEVRTELVAFIADDDMWSRHHIGEALRHLSLHPSAIGYFGQVVVVDNDSRQITAPYGRPIQTLLPPASVEYRSASVWTAREVLLESMLRTPLTIWALLGKTSAIREAASFLEEGPGGVDSDRFFAWRLACQGEIVVGTEVSLFMRLHGDNACARMSAEAIDFHRRKAFEYSSIMIAESRRMGIDCRESWMDWWRLLSPEERERIWGLRILGARDALREALGPDFHPPDVRWEGSRLRALLPLVPPALLPALRRCSDLLQRFRS